MHKERVLPLQGVHNFRDYGGYATSGGGRVKRGLLWRSGQHYEASDEDIAAIAGLRLAHVFDLRSDRERASHPCRRPEPFAAIVHTIPDGSANQAPHVSSARRDAESTRASMRRSYEGIAFRPILVSMVRNMAEQLARGDGASLVNCMAGKDRTGFAVAMVHHALGVHRDDIFEDYLLTNSAGNALDRIEAGQRSIRTIIGDIDPEALRVLMSVEPEYLETAFSAVREKHGSIDAYQAEVLGIDDALRERLRAALVDEV
ncbi:tyrosine-protein phosphatase [Novosphingobium sp. TH158]|uniref:tyrosine-protein phosphatase n=1 Tax=Novosphingobium sp. TH158 TaxID=2067455 RepID=UPI000C7C67F2|nr:tyrosine-protein phosphatase [Novosphingobium sp. TH158]PLK25762.1 protein-tyrosine-phosphatase [Novosphingobium sp. TH158]